MKTGTKSKDNQSSSHNGHKSIRVNFTEDEYDQIINDRQYFRKRLDFFINEFPDLFPSQIQNGYYLHSTMPSSKKQGISVRLISIKGMEMAVSRIRAHVHPTAM